jgi:iron(III) transport system ATP-binding protein
VRVHLRGEIKALQRRLGITTIMVTHDQEEALSIADRIVVMNRGRIEQVGTPDAVYRAPASLFVAGFVGQMNSLPATVADAGTVAVGRAMIAADAAAGFPSGASVQLCIRPEDVEPDHPSLPGTRLATTVRGVEYLGSIGRVSLDAHGLPLTAEFSDTRLRALAIAPGMTLAVVIPPARALLFPRPAG